MRVLRGGNNSMRMQMTPGIIRPMPFSGFPEAKRDLFIIQRCQLAPQLKFENLWCPQIRDLLAGLCLPVVRPKIGISSVLLVARAPACSRPSFELWPSSSRPES
ncbi:hypothetical protein I7I50_09349 [Histoplasma capsulatum G186AR]|uniref:Uncharacterized protein n=1 Tax=Ajellomyces capsulatus TaxID=5037 RepID=A0A8H8D1C6_AJECA|nr:hypothetical protein I7I52_06870 [Histoplasma capsulatum]QSS74250.1 hypothetical protein I7I50_09349 [Histoplasma capsulatum G186AR]